MLKTPEMVVASRIETSVELILNSWKAQIHATRLQIRTQLALFGNSCCHRLLSRGYRPPPRRPHTPVRRTGPAGSPCSRMSRPDCTKNTITDRPEPLQQRHLEYSGRGGRRQFERLRARVKRTSPATWPPYGARMTGPPGRSSAIALSRACGAQPLSLAPVQAIKPSSPNGAQPWMAAVPSPSLGIGKPIRHRRPSRSRSTSTGCNKLAGLASQPCVAQIGALAGNPLHGLRRAATTPVWCRAQATPCALNHASARRQPSLASAST